MTDRGLKPKHLKEPLRLVLKEVENLLGLLTRGGEGSGHFGHSGRPGKVGGSQAGKSPTNRKRVAPCLRKLLTSEEIELWHQGMTRGMRSFSPRRVRDESFDESWIGEDGLVYKLEGRTHDSAAMEGMENTRIVYRENVIGGTVAALHTYAEMVTNMLGWLRLSGSRFESAISFHVDVPPTDEQVFSAMHMIAKGGADKLEEFHWEGHNFRISEDGWALSNDPVSGVGAISFYKWLEKHSPAVARSFLSIIERHYGPGPHSGTGTPQDVHGGDGEGTAKIKRITAGYYEFTASGGRKGRIWKQKEAHGGLPWTWKDDESTYPFADYKTLKEAKAGVISYYGDEEQADETEVELKFRPIDYSFDQTGLISAWIDNEQVGSLAFGAPTKSKYFGEYDVELGWVVVPEEHRRKGIATAMMDEFYRQFEGKRIVPYETTEAGDAFMKAYVNRHYGPGPHKGTGTPQSVHGGGSGAASPSKALYGRANRLDKNIDYIEDFIDKYSDAPIEHAYIWDEENPDYFREAVGTTDEIDISAYFVRGRTAIHNHPMGVGILSHQDFQFLMYHDMREMMVIANTPEYGKTRSSMRLKKPITPEGFAFGKDLFKIEDAFLAKSTELAKDYKLGEKISPASNVKLWISHMDALYRWTADEYPEYFEYYSEGFPA